jgi:hypothetical protein
MTSSKAVHRHLCSELVLIAPTDGRGWLGMLGNLEEIGEWFAEVLTESAFPCNASVRIQSRSHQLQGRVKSCKYEKPLGYIVKVKLDPQSRWSDRWFTPKHLLELWGGTEPKVSTLKAASDY